MDTDSGISKLAIQDAQSQPHFHGFGGTPTVPLVR